MAERVNNRNLWLFTLLTVLVASALISRMTWPGWQHWLGMSLFLVMSWISEANPVHLPFTKNSGTISVTGALIAATFILFGALPAAVIGTLGTIRLKDVRGQTKLVAFVFNRAQCGLWSGLSGVVYGLLGGHSLLVQHSINVAAIVAAGLCMTVLNIALSVAYIAVKTGRPMRSIFVWDISFALANVATFVIMGALMAAVYLSTGALGTVLFFVPLLFSRFTMQKYIEVHEAYADAVTTLVRAIEAKDAYTAGHSQRVADLCLSLAIRMRIPERIQESLYYVGYLHDLGKIGIPEHILKKPGALTIDEYAVMQQHPTIGAELVKNFKFLGRLVECVAHHHERLDGKGFPMGVMAGELGLETRIITVVDAYDAMNSDRPYRKGRAAEECCRELIAQAGVQFDPDVVREFVAMMGGSMPEGYDHDVKERMRRWQTPTGGAGVAEAAAMR